VLPLDPGHGLFNIREDRAMEQEPGARPLDRLHKDVFVKRAGDRLTFLFRVGQPFQRCQELLACVEELDRYPHRLEKPDDSLRFAALDGIARAQEGKGDLDAAAKGYQKAGEVEFYKDRAALEQGRVLAKAGKIDQARKAVEAVAKDSKDPTLQAEAQERLARLGGQ
jgi:tetratricopeptide (TPR) repeat protein